MAEPSDDDFWKGLGTKPEASPASEPTAPPAHVDDGFWSTLGTSEKPDTAAPAEDKRIHFDPARLSIVGNSVLRGLHQGLDVPAEALARGADWVAGKLGFASNQGAQTAAADAAFNQDYDANPLNQGIGPGAARLGGNLLATLPAAIATGGLASGAVGAGARARMAVAPRIIVQPASSRRTRRCSP